MITPPQPALAPHPRETRAKPAETQAGPAFTEVLAATLQSRRPLEFLPTLEHGPAIARIPCEPEPSERVAGAASPAPDQRPAALVFNEDGFFGSIDARGAQANGIAQTPSRSALSLAVTDDRSAGESDTRSRLTASVIPSASAGTEPIKPHTGAVISKFPTAKALAVAPPARIGNLAAGNAVEPIKTLAQRLSARRPAAARSAVEVAVRELEHGLHVTARVDALDEAERRRLHDEIAALLASHGLTGSIHIAGRQIVRATLQEKLK